MTSDIINQVKWNSDGLVPAIAQQYDSKQVLMMAWMNAESLRLSLEEGRAIYYSRSRQKLWRKGEESGHVQTLKEVRLDCDGDTILLIVDQIGGIACHTGRAHCFYYRFEDNQWQDVENVIKSSEEIYSKQ